MKLLSLLKMVACLMMNWLLLRVFNGVLLPLYLQELNYYNFNFINR
jgi:hypothetical protein